MKKLISIIFLLVCIFTLAACRKEDIPEENPDDVMNAAINKIEISATIDKDTERIILPNNIILETKQNVYFIWSSENPDVISDSGVVTHDIMYDHTVNLTVKAKYKTFEKSHVFTITVKNTDADTIANNLLDALTVPESISEDLALKNQAVYQDQTLDIVWISSNETLLTNGGTFLAQTKNDVYLTAKITLNGKEYKKDFPVGLYPRTHYQIDDISDFALINNDLDGLYSLNSDLDFLNQSVPVVGSSTQPFTGILHGNGHVLSHVSLTVNDEATGLFAVNEGFIDTLAITGLSLTGTVSTQNYIGGLVGLNNGVLDQCFVDGNLAVDDAKTSEIAVGGLIGQMNGGVVSNCASSVIVTVNALHATDDIINVGGFVGRVNDGVIRSSYYEDRLNAKNNSTGTSVSVTNARDNTISAALFAGTVNGGLFRGDFALGSLVVSGYVDGSHTQISDNFAGSHVSYEHFIYCFVLDTSRILGRTPTVTFNQMSSSTMVTEDWYHTCGFVNELWDFVPIHDGKLGVAVLKIFE